MIPFGPDEGPDAPVGAICAWCDETFVFDDYGFAQPTLDGYNFLHRECHTRTMMGSFGHLVCLCSCHGGDLEDPPLLTKRQAAVATYLVMIAWRRRGKA